MVAKRVTKGDEDFSEPNKRPPATTPQARENQMIALAMDLVEKRIRKGTATSQETTHFLKLASVRSTYENEKLQLEKELLKAKVDQIANQGKHEELVANALKAMQSYTGHGDDEYED